LGKLVVAGRVAVAVAVARFLAVGLQGRVAKVLEKATVPVSDDGLAWIRRGGRSLPCALDLGASGCCQVLLFAAVAADLLLDGWCSANRGLAAVTVVAC